MILKLIALTLPLCIDSFLICSAISISQPTRKQKLKLSLTFAAFEGGMPLLGLAVGSLLSRGLGSMAEYLAGSILLAFGLYSLITSRKEDANARRMSTTRGLALIGLGLGISVDSLAIGFSYGLLKIPALLATTVIVVQTIIATQFGFSLGKLLPSKFRVFGEGLAGLVLAVIGGFIIISKALS